MASNLEQAFQQILVGAAQATYDNVEVRSNLWPKSFRFSLSEQLDSPPGPLTRWLQPKFTFSGGAGKQEFAPQGEPSRPWLGVAVAGGAVVVVLGLGFIIGKLTS
jgi:hypothetical protein